MMMQTQTFPIRDNQSHMKYSCDFSRDVLLSTIRKWWNSFRRRTKQMTAMIHFYLIDEKNTHIHSILLCAYTSNHTALMRIHFQVYAHLYCPHSIINSFFANEKKNYIFIWYTMWVVHFWYDTVWLRYNNNYCDYNHSTTTTTTKLYGSHTIGHMIFDVNF